MLSNYGIEIKKAPPFTGGALDFILNQALTAGLNLYP